jgi:hypothetical protein
MELLRRNSALKAGAPELHPGLCTLGELNARGFEDGTYGLEVLARHERLADATLRTLNGMRRNSRLLGEFGLAPAEQLPRRLI